MSPLPRSEWPTESPISPVSPYIPCKEYDAIEKDLRGLPPGGWSWFFIAMFAAMVISAVFILPSGERSPEPVRSATPTTTATVTPSYNPSFITPPDTLPR